MNAVEYCTHGANNREVQRTIDKICGPTFTWRSHDLFALALPSDWCTQMENHFDCPSPSTPRTQRRNWKVARCLMKERTSFWSFDRGFRSVRPETGFIYLPLFSRPHSVAAGLLLVIIIPFRVELERDSARQRIEIGAGAVFVGGGCSF